MQVPRGEGAVGVSLISISKPKPTEPASKRSGPWCRGPRGVVDAARWLGACSGEIEREDVRISGGAGGGKTVGRGGRSGVECDIGVAVGRGLCAFG